MTSGMNQSYPKCIHFTSATSIDWIWIESRVQSISDFYCIICDWPSHVGFLSHFLIVMIHVRRTLKLISSNQLNDKQTNRTTWATSNFILVAFLMLFSIVYFVRCVGNCDAFCVWKMVLRFEKWKTTATTEEKHHQRQSPNRWFYVISIGNVFGRVKKTKRTHTHIK